LSALGTQDRQQLEQVVRLTGRRIEKLVMSLLSVGRDGVDTGPVATLTSSVLCKLPRLATLSDRPDSTCQQPLALYIHSLFQFLTVESP